MRNDFCSNYLEHSAKGTSWRKKGAKYLSRVWKNGRWVYEYKITGKGYKRDANKYYKAEKQFRSISNNRKSEADNLRNKNVYKADILDKASDSYTRKASNAQKKAIKANANYVNSSIVGRGERIISKLLDSLKPQTTVRITSNLMPANTEKVYKKKK